MLLERRTRDPSSIVGASLVLRASSAETVSAVAAAIQPVELPAGESPFREDDRIAALYLVERGALHGFEKRYATVFADSGTTFALRRPGRPAAVRDVIGDLSRRLALPDLFTDRHPLRTDSLGRCGLA